MSAKTKELLKVLKFSVSFSREYTVRYTSKIDPLPTKYGGKSNITVLPGVGIGPEIMETTLKILRAARAPLSYEILTLSPTEEESQSDEFQQVLTSIRRNRVAIKGNIENKSKNPYAVSRNVLLRKSLDLYVNILHCKTYPALKNKFGEIDLVVIRQNTEGEYLMLEHEPTPASVESLKIITEHACERLARFAFKYALKYDRKMITVVHNADILPKSEGLFVEAAMKVSRDYPTIKLNITEIGVCACRLVQNPWLYDIILTTNLNGSMLSNILNGMLGGPGLSAGINLGGSGIAVFEPGARNKGSSIVGRGIANPFAMIKAAINLLNYLGHYSTANIIQHALYVTLVLDKVTTPDLGGNSTTQEITNKLIYHIGEQFLLKKGEKKGHRTAKVDFSKAATWFSSCWSRVPGRLTSNRINPRSTTKI